MLICEGGSYRTSPDPRFRSNTAETPISIARIPSPTMRLLRVGRSLTLIISCQGRDLSLFLDFRAGTSPTNSTKAVVLTGHTTARQDTALFALGSHILDDLDVIDAGRWFQHSEVDACPH